MRLKLISLKPYLCAAGFSLSAALLTLPPLLTSAGARQDATDGRGDPARKSHEVSKPRPRRPAAPSESLRRVQEALNLAGYDVGKPNGFADSRTTTALQRFQADRGLRVTGRADTPTLAALSLGDVASPRPPSMCGANPPQRGTGRQHNVNCNFTHPMADFWNHPLAVDPAKSLIF
jgi:hypothetical protein